MKKKLRLKNKASKENVTNNKYQNKINDVKNEKLKNL